MNAAATAIASRVLRGGRLRGVRGAYDILPVETHWVASLGMWLPDWYDREPQRPDPHNPKAAGGRGPIICRGRHH